jgi:hypothetical protein
MEAVRDLHLAHFEPGALFVYTTLECKNHKLIIPVLNWKILEIRTTACFEECLMTQRSLSPFPKRGEILVLLSPRNNQLLVLLVLNHPQPTSSAITSIEGIQNIDISTEQVMWSPISPDLPSNANNAERSVRARRHERYAALAKNHISRRAS